MCVHALCVLCVYVACVYVREGVHVGVSALVCVCHVCRPAAALSV